MSSVSIAGLDKVAILAAFYNRAQPQGMGYAHFHPKSMTVEEAQAILDGNSDMYFDYLKGRVMKVDLSKNDVNTALYNRDNGFEAAEKVIDGVRFPGKISLATT